MTKPFITVDGITARLRDRWLFNGLSWQINVGEQWAVIGSNGAGKTTLARAIAGHVPVVQGKIHYSFLKGLHPAETIAYVASDARRDLWRRESILDKARGYAGRFHDVTTVRRLIHHRHVPALSPGEIDSRLTTLGKSFNLDLLLEKPVMAVSTGEMSRILIVRELIRRPKMLILDEPFEGLDGAIRQDLMDRMDRLSDTGLPTLLITHRPEEMLAGTTHVLTMEDGQIVGAEPINRFSHRFFSDSAVPSSNKARWSTGNHVTLMDAQSLPRGEPLIDMQAVTVHYGDTIVLDRFNWTVDAGEHWAVTGPNGAGKSTILKLITGDCLQVYANRIRLFGKARGVSQNLWEIRKRLGVVSPDLVAGYQKEILALDVVSSGFFDSVGLYRYCDPGQVKTAEACLDQMGMSALSQTPFNHLSQGQRQMVLIARAMVKSPNLLILDEPCAGLDPQNRRTILSMVEHIGRSGSTGLIFVSHHEKEIPPCITHRLLLSRGIVVSSGPV